MTRRRTLSTIAAGAASLAAAVALTLTPAAQAATIFDLANLGYQVTTTDVGGGCSIDTADGFGSSWSGNTCDGGFQSGLDGFAAGHPERKLGFQHPAAVAARGDLQGKGYQVSTSYDGPTFTVTGDCNVNASVDAQGIVSLDQSLPASAPCQTATTTTPATTTPATSPPPAQGATPPPPAAPTCDVQCQIDGLQAQITALRDQLARLVQILETWPSIDPGILAQLMSLQP